jgi:hypothetical protein
MMKNFSVKDVNKDPSVIQSPLWGSFYTLKDHMSCVNQNHQIEGETLYTLFVIVICQL